MAGRVQRMAQAVCAAARQSSPASTSGAQGLESRYLQLLTARSMTTATEYAKKRAEYTEKLSELRKAWAVEHAERVAAKEAKRAAEKCVVILESSVCWA